VGIRETINKNPKQAIGIGVCVLVMGVLLMIWQLWPQKPPVAAPGRAYFTVDDGASYFEDDATHVPPFQHDGKEAVRAHVYRCGETGRAFVGWMEKYSPQTKDKIDKFWQDPANRTKFPPEYGGERGHEYRKVGSALWRPWSNEVFTLGQYRCPDGTMASEVLPPRKP
jgi:hypothetical protein